MKNGFCQNKVPFFLRMDYFSLSFSPEYLSYLTSFQNILYCTRHNYDFDQNCVWYLSLDERGFHEFRTKQRANFFLSPLITLNKIIPHIVGSTWTLVAMHACTEWIKPHCCARLLFPWASLTAEQLGLQQMRSILRMSTTGLFRMPLTGCLCHFVCVCACSNVLLITYFLKHWAWSAGQKHALFFQFSKPVFCWSTSTKRAEDRGEGKQSVPLGELLVFLRDGGSRLHLWHKFVIDSL